MSEGMSEDDHTFEYLTNKLRKKYARRKTSWQIQKDLSLREQQPGERLDSFANSLTNIGFGKRVLMESYLGAFYDGLNNQDAAAHVRTMRPETLSEALEYAIEAYGEYGAGRKVTTWKEAQQQYRTTGSSERKSSTAPPKKLETKVEVSPVINWSQLGLGFGGSDIAPKYDDTGKPVSGLANTTAVKDGGLPLATLQAIAVAAGLGQVAAAHTSTPKIDSKPKAAKALKTEPAEEELSAVPPEHGTGRQNYSGYQYDSGGRGGNGNYDGRGRGGYHNNERSGYGGGRGNYRHFGGRGGGRGAFDGSTYGPPDNRPIMQRKAESVCKYCGQVGHWWKECQVRLGGGPRQSSPPQSVPQLPQPAQAPIATTSSTSGPTTTPGPNAGNGPRQ